MTIIRDTDGNYYSARAFPADPNFWEGWPVMRISDSWEERKGAGWRCIPRAGTVIVWEG